MKADYEFPVRTGVKNHLAEMSNKIPQVAKLLGVELYETFLFANSYREGLYRFTDTDLECFTNFSDAKDNHWFKCNEYLIDLIKYSSKIN